MLLVRFGSNTSPYGVSIPVIGWDKGLVWAKRLSAEPGVLSQEILKRHVVPTTCSYATDSRSKRKEDSASVVVVGCGGSDSQSSGSSVAAAVVGWENSMRPTCLEISWIATDFPTLSQLYEI